jgi:hypothetical protein
LLLAAREAQGGALERAVHLGVETGALQRLVHRRRDLTPAGAAARLLAQREADVVEDRHRKRIGLLEDHRDAPAQVGIDDLVDVLAVEQDPSTVACARR